MTEQCRIFSVNLNRLLNETGKLQVEVAHAIGVSQQTFNTWTKGKAFPRIDKVQALADYFKVDKTDLIDESPEGLTYPQIIGSNIRRYLKMHDMSQTELAKRLGVSQQTVSYWCNGLKSPRQLNIDDMCEIFNCQRTSLMQENTILSKTPQSNYEVSNKKKIDTIDILTEAQKMDGPKLNALLMYARFLNSQQEGGD